MATRAEHRRDTLLALGDAAIDLFESTGPSATIDAIARRAGVSRRTIFRYVNAKEELAFVHPLLWFDVFDAALAEFSERETIDRLQAASRAIADHIDSDPEPPRRAFIVAASNPELLSGYNATYQRWVDRVAVELLPADATADDRFRSRIGGSLVMGMVDAVTREWLIAPPGLTFADLYDKGWEMIEPSLRA